MWKKLSKFKLHHNQLKLPRKQITIKLREDIIRKIDGQVQMALLEGWNFSFDDAINSSLAESYDLPR